MAEFTEIMLQEVESLQNVLFTENPVTCNRGYVLHRAGAGIFTLRGVSNQCRARYRVSFGANIAIPTGGTVDTISIALAIDGEALGSATAIETPTAVEAFSNVYVSAIVDVPAYCCVSVSVKNTSDQAINVQNANLIIDRIA